ncbi:MAG: hypothetical protein IJ816_03790 [Alloprevotella sp.]|nr:hypothetical protein [Alloprevotella sp.]
MLRESLHHFFVRLRRIAYRKGYGIHSPFAFDFVTRVIYGRLPRADRKMLSHLPQLQRRIEMLLWRVAIDQQPSFIYISEDFSPILRQQLNFIAPVQSIRQWKPDVENALVCISGASDAAVLQTDLSQTDERTKVLLTSIYVHSDASLIWDACKPDKSVRVTFDLYDLGILIFNKILQKQDYLISF